MFCLENIKIRLDSIIKVKEFVNIASRCAGKVEVSLKGFTADGKSVLGVCSLDLKNELTLDVKSEEDMSAIMNELVPFIVV